MATGGQCWNGAVSGLAALLVLSVITVPSQTHASGGGTHHRRHGVCSELRGAARGLCVAYCEVLECDVRTRPGCAALLTVFQRLTGRPALPCEAACGDGKVDAPGEECDPAAGACVDAQACNADCTCPPPPCGNGIVDTGEACDPAVAACSDGQQCNADCTCPPPLCGNGLLDAQEQCDPPGSPCPAGDVCSATCTCGGPHPECAGSVCGLYAPCNPGTACEEPVCASTAEGGGVCIEGSVFCEDLTDCTTSADCPSGGACVVQSCCSRPVCIPSIAVCKPLPLSA